MSLVEVACTDCAGTGARPNRPGGLIPMCGCGMDSLLEDGSCGRKECKPTCILCVGSGKRMALEALPMKPCWMCKGTGNHQNKTCRRCDGKGEREDLDGPENFEKRDARRKAVEEALFNGVRSRQAELEALLNRVNGHWNYEDGVYRFYHHSFKVYYRLQPLTDEIVETMRSLVPQGVRMAPLFVEILSEGTGKQFQMDHNDDWAKHTRPIVEAFFHAKYFLEMAVIYGKELADEKQAPRMMPSGWASLMTLFCLY